MKNDNGFSLIELIIVVAVMAVLIAVIIPNLSKYLSKSKQQADNNNKDEIERIMYRACSQIGADVTEPTMDSWIELKEDSVIYDSSDISLKADGTQSFAGFVASELSKIPKSQVTGDYFKVRITQDDQGRYKVEVK